MIDNIPSDLPEIITSASNAVHQNLPETEKQTDGALSTVVGFFNNVVLYPVKKANLTYRYKLENFEDDLKQKIQKIPHENLQVPPTMIAGPVLEALRYTYDEKELREMFENLLASAMDARIVGQAHPSFVNAITQLNPLDALVFKAIVKEQTVTLAHIVIVNTEHTMWYPNAMPYYFSPTLHYIGDAFNVSVSISNLIRLGLVKTNIVFLTDEHKTEIEHNEYVQKIYTQFPTNSVKIEVSGEGTTIELDNYGRAFAKTCLETEGDGNAD